MHYSTYLFIVVLSYEWIRIRVSIDGYARVAHCCIAGIFSSSAVVVVVVMPISTDCFSITFLSVFLCVMCASARFFLSPAFQSLLLMWLYDHWPQINEFEWNRHTHIHERNLAEWIWIFSEQQNETKKQINGKHLVHHEHRVCVCVCAYGFNIESCGLAVSRWIDAIRHETAILNDTKWPWELTGARAIDAKNLSL